MKKGRVVHVIGNGDQSQIYNMEPRKGIKLICNLPPFPVNDAYATCVVDFKMCKAIDEGSVLPPGEWIMGVRPKMYCEKNVAFYGRHASKIKEFFTDKPDYVNNYTDFNCGHMATYYALHKLQAAEVHMYGFDSIFDMNLRSVSDFVLHSDRENTNSFRLSNNWRPIWKYMFEEFPEVKFYLYHNHDKPKIELPSNVEVIVRRKNDKK